MTNEKPSDPNVVELRSVSSGADYGDMLRLAVTMVMVRDSDLDGFPDMWDYLKSKGFEPSFIDRAAKSYWRVACRVVGGIPYRFVVTEKGCLSAERRLMAHFLRLVCEVIASEVEKAPLTLVRELGFNNIMGVGRTPTEEVFFLGPRLRDGTQESGFNATDEAILEFIAHCEHQAQVAKDYLANHKNNKTHEWQPAENRCASCGSTNPETWPTVQYGGQDYPCPNKAFHDPTSL